MHYEQSYPCVLNAVRCKLYMIFFCFFFWYKMSHNLPEIFLLANAGLLLWTRFIFECAFIKASSKPCLDDERKSSFNWTYTGWKKKKYRICLPEMCTKRCTEYTVHRWTVLIWLGSVGLSAIFTISHSTTDYNFCKLIHTYYKRDIRWLDYCVIATTKYSL